MGTQVQGTRRHAYFAIHGTISDYIEPLADDMGFVLAYGKEDVKPHEFLKKFSNAPNSLTDKEN